MYGEVETLVKLEGKMSAWFYVKVLVHHVVNVGTAIQHFACLIC